MFLSSICYDEVIKRKKSLIIQSNPLNLLCLHSKNISQIMNQDNTIDYFLKTSWQTVANKYNLIASQFGFTQAAGYILINIHKDGTSVSQIANSTGVKTTSLSRVLNNLESLGFIYREVNAQDKRSVKVYLTELGKQKRKIAKDVVREFNDYLESAIPKRERELFVNLLQKVNVLAANYDPKVKEEVGRIENLKI